MAALARLSMKIFTNSNLPSSKPLLSRCDIHFLPSQKLPVNFSRSVSLDLKTVRSLASPLDTEVPTGLQTAETGIQAIETTKTAHVKFQLQRECLFGEYFLLVGDDPIMGSWNPSQAIPLIWSEEHMWTVELDVPTEKTLQFKFLLKQRTGDILWQPGPDRIFHSWETSDTITIAEPWEDAEAQKLTNEQLVTHPDMELSSELKPNVNEDLPNVNEDLMFLENIADPEEKSTVNRSNEFMTTGNVKESKDGCSVDNVGFEGPVLVPGLTPLQGMSTEEPISNESVKSIIADTSVGIDAAKDHNNMPDDSF